METYKFLFCIQWDFNMAIMAIKPTSDFRTAVEKQEISICGPALYFVIWIKWFNNKMKKWKKEEACIAFQQAVIRIM